jgi:hypothetical protein
VNANVSIKGECLSLGRCHTSTYVYIILLILLLSRLLPLGLEVVDSSIEGAGGILFDDLFRELEE